MKKMMRRFANFLNSRLWEVGDFQINVDINTYNGISIEDIQKLKKIIHNFILNRENGFDIFSINDEDEFESSDGITYYMLNAKVYMTHFELKKYYRIVDYIEKYRKNHIIFISNIAWH